MEIETFISKVLECVANHTLKVIGYWFWGRPSVDLNNGDFYRADKESRTWSAYTTNGNLKCTGREGLDPF